MIHLATLPSTRLISSAEMAAACSAPESFMAKVLQRLVARGLVESHRGQGGGFRLAVPPADVSMLEVVEIVDGPILLNSCVDPADHCEVASCCAAKPVWAEAQARVREVLAAARLDQLAQNTFAAREALVALGSDPGDESANRVPA